MHEHKQAQVIGCDKEERWMAGRGETERQGERWGGDGERERASVRESDMQRGKPVRGAEMKREGQRLRG